MRDDFNKIRDDAISLDCILAFYGDEDSGCGGTYEQVYGQRDEVLCGDEAMEVDRRWADFHFGSRSRRR